MTQEQIELLKEIEILKRKRIKELKKQNKQLEENNRQLRIFILLQILRIINH